VISTVRTRRGVVWSALAGDSPARLSIAAIEAQGRQAAGNIGSGRGVRGGRIHPIDLEPKILALKEQRSPGRRSFETVDLGVGHAGDHSGVQQHRWIDPQLRTIAERQHAPPSQICTCRADWRAEQSLDIAADVKRIVLPGQRLESHSRGGFVTLVALAGGDP
jgi:hypothetical protein